MRLLNRTAELQPTAAELLQSVLAQLLDLSLIVRQARWNSTDSDSAVDREGLNALRDGLDQLSDRVAVRLVELAEPVDATAAHLSAASTIPALVSGFLDERVGEMLAFRVGLAVETTRRAVERLEELDAPSYAVAERILEGLEERHRSLLGTDSQVSAVSA